jgi:hypothetical protein
MEKQIVYLQPHQNPKIAFFKLIHVQVAKVVASTETDSLP